MMLALPSVPFIPSLLCPLPSLGTNVAVEKAPAVVTSGVEAIQHRSSGPDGRSDICVARGWSLEISLKGGGLSSSGALGEWFCCCFNLMSLL